MSTIPSTRRLRSHRRQVDLTWDVLLLVFQEADVATLAVLGRVSLDFLASTSPLLYRDIEIRSKVALKRLFCSRGGESENPSSRINHLLSLVQLRNLHVDLTVQFNARENFYLPDPIPSRIYPVPIDSLRLSCPYFVPESDFNTIAILQSLLLPYLNPLRLSYNIRDRSRNQPSRFQLVQTGRIYSKSRIQIFEMQGAVVYSEMRQKYRLGGFCTLGSSGIDPLPGRHTLRLHLEGLFDDFSNGTELGILQTLQARHQRFNLLGGFDQKGSVVLVVSSEDMKRKTEAAIQVLDASVRPIFVVEFAG